MERILFIDDEPYILDSIRRMLHSERGKWDISFAIGGEEGLKVMEQKGPFDIVISDMLMPKMNGAELLRTVRERYPAASRIVLSGFAEKTLAIQAISVAHQLLNKPCKGEELKSTIRNLFDLRKQFDSPALLSFVGSIRALPVLPQAYDSLFAALERPETAPEDVADIFESDISLSSKLLHLANSSFFNVSHEIFDIFLATKVLGVDIMRNMLTAPDSFQIFSSGCDCPNSFIEQIRNRTKQIVAIVRNIDMDRHEQEIAIIAARLQDIGQIVLYCEYGDRFPLIREAMQSHDCSLEQAEKELFGFTHAQLSACLLGLWGLDKEVVKVVSQHCDPSIISHSSLDASTAVYLADLLVREHEEHPGDIEGLKIRKTDAQILDDLGMKQQYSRIRNQENLYHFDK